MLQIIRSLNLRIPRKTEISINDIIAIKKEISMAENMKFNENKIKEKIMIEDNNIKLIEKIPYNSNALVVITIAKNYVFM